MSIKDLNDLFLHGLRDIYFAEKKIAQALPKMSKAVKSEKLREAFDAHLKETHTQIERLEKVFANCNVRAEGEECPAIEGLIEEGEHIMDEVEDDDVLSAALLADAQAVEHYEIARYGTLCEWAELLGHEENKRLLAETLEEEKNADRKLTKIAEERVNDRAAA
jgi:ferritin-like metal-binding protein YciE